MEHPIQENASQEKAVKNGTECAYPIAAQDYYPKFGLTKRELFAAMALQGAMGNNELLMHFAENGLEVEHYCLRAADALLIALAE